jgi:SNW domain-containing protein 1
LIKYLWNFNIYRDKIIPSYPNRNDKIFIPVDDKDFGDGGAYPEIHIVQYPLDLGKPGVKSTAGISVNVDENGQVSYDAVVKQGVNRNKIIQTSLQDIKEKEASKELTALPDEKEEQDITESTKYALEALLNGKIKSSTGTSVVHSTDAPEPTYIRYTPNPSAPGYVLNFHILFGYYIIFYILGLLDMSKESFEWSKLK